MAQDPIRACLATAREDFSETSQISAEARRAVASFAKRQYIFDFIAELLDSPDSSGFLRALSGCFPGSERVWWAVVLHTLRPPSSDPIHWSPTLADYYMLELLLDEVESLEVSYEDLLALLHYPLARIVDDLLMSSAFAGCGVETVEQWRTEDFYRQILASKSPASTGRSLTPMARAEALIAQILRILENHGLPRLRLGIGSATLYYSIPDEDLLNAKADLIQWLLKQGVGPYLLYMVRSGILAPSEGVLLPNFPRIEELEKCPCIVAGPLGPMGSTLFVEAIRSIEASASGDPGLNKNARVAECVASYVRWHESLGLFDALEAVLTQ